ncbi:hypothetical protein FE249_15875 [Acidiphilium multivorum]|nr:hypothetical protein FE249_15875 [Acidiphilium multivorum]
MARHADDPHRDDTTDLADGRARQDRGRAGMNVRTEGGDQAMASPRHRLRALIEWMSAKSVVLYDRPLMALTVVLLGAIALVDLALLIRAVSGASASHAGLYPVDK